MADPNKSRSITQRGHVSSPGPDTSPLPRVAGDKERGKKGGEENFELQSLSLECLLKVSTKLRRRQNLNIEDGIFSLQQSLNGWVPGSAGSALAPQQPRGDGELCPRDRDQ